MKIVSIRTIIGVTALVCYIQSALAQENFMAGYILQQQGDTVKGFIDFRNRDFNPKKISFRLENKSEKTVYSVLDIKGFGVSGEAYVSAVVRINTVSNNSQDLEENAYIRLKTDTTFLKVLISGPKSLYYYSDSQGSEQFYIPKKDSFDLLLYKKYYGIVADAKTFLENKKFVGQLTLYFQDCPSLKRKLGQVKYTRESLQSLFAQYYAACNKSEIIFKSIAEKTIMEWGLVAGATRSTIRFTGYGGQPYVLRSRFPQSFNPAAGLYLEIVFPRNQRKWSIYNELNYTSYRVNGEDDDIQNTFQYTITHCTLAYSYVKLSNMLRYRYPVGKFLVFFNAGISNGLVVSETNHTKQDSRIFTAFTTKEGKYLDDTRSYEQGYLLGLGAKSKRYTLEFRYEKGNGITPYIGLGSPTTRLYLLFGYRF